MSSSNYHWQLGPLSFSPVLILKFLSTESNEPLTVCWISSGARDCVNYSLDDYRLNLAVGLV